MQPPRSALPLQAQEVTEPTVQREEVSRPLTDLVRETFGEGRIADVVEFLIEPALQILLVIVIVGVLKWLANRVINRVTERMKTPPGVRGRQVGTVSARRATRADALGTLLRSVATVVLVTIGVFMALGVFGINLAPLIAGAGILGLAIGFGAQNLVADFLAGIFMLAEDQYGVGDFVDTGDGVIGQVEGLSLRTTRIRAMDGTVWHVPNGEIRRTGNMSQGWGRVVLDVAVSYGADIDQSAAIIKEVADDLARDEAHGANVLSEPELWGVEDLGADGVVIRLAVQTRPATQWGLARELRRRIKYALDGADIEIPFPQRTVWLRTDATGTDRPEIAVPSGDDG